MCCRAVSRWLAYSVAVLADLVGGEEGESFRGQDKGERCAEPSTLGCGLVLQGCLGRCREVFENTARLTVGENSACKPHCCTSQAKLA
jgi:hypothetical protein